MEFKTLLPTKLFEILDKHDISTSKQILIKSVPEIKKITNLNKHDITLTKNIAAEFVFSSSIFRGDELLNNIKPKVTTGCKELNSFLGGGFRRGTLTEIFGESGSGKTQICIHASIHNWQNGTVYICTEDLFPAARFNQIKESLPNYNKNIDYGSNVFVEHVTECSELHACIMIRLPKLMEKHSPSLIIIDSIAAPYRSEVTNYIKRAQDLREIVIHLLGMAKKYNAAVLCTNQVSANFETENDEVVPCLGLAWTNLVNTRLCLKKTNEMIQETRYKGNQNETPIRELNVGFAPDLENFKINIIITASGLNYYKT